MIFMRHTIPTLLVPLFLTLVMIDSSQAMAAAQSPNPHAISMYNLGLKAFKEGSPESAIIFFKRAADIDPNLADAQYNLGVLYQHQRRYKESVPRFKEVLRIKPNDPDAHYQLGLDFVALKQPADALRHFQAVPPSNSNFNDAQKHIASIRANPGQSEIQPKPIVRQPAQPQAQTQSQVQPRAYQSPPNTTPQQYTPPATSAPVAAGSPTPILPNASVRVIATGFKAPSGLTFDRFGNLYVANYKSNTIDRISSDGSRTQFCSGGHLKGPIGLAADDDGNIYVANYAGGTIARITPAGISTVIATGFKKPYYMILDRGGNLFVSQQEDNSIIRVTLPRVQKAGSRSRSTLGAAP